MKKSLYLKNKNSTTYYIKILSVIFTVLLLGFISVDFFLFTKNLPTKEETPILSKLQFDGIIAFTGGQFRLGTTSLIIQNGFKGPVFISGIYPGIDIKQTFKELGLNNHQLNQINFDYSAVSTASNVKQALNWIKSNRLNKILVITSYYHIPRTKLLFNKIQNNVTFIYYPVFSNNANFNLLFSEYIKYLLFNFNTIIKLSLRSQLPY